MQEKLHIRLTTTSVCDMMILLRHSVKEGLFFYYWRPRAEATELTVSEGRVLWKWMNTGLRSPTHKKELALNCCIYLLHQLRANSHLSWYLASVWNLTFRSILFCKCFDEIFPSFWNPIQIICFLLQFFIFTLGRVACMSAVSRWSTSFHRFDSIIKMLIRHLLMS